MKPLQLGRTAVYARALAARALGRVAALTGMLFTLGGATVLVFTYRSSLLVPWSIVAVPAAGVALLGIRRFNVEYLKARAGVRAEARTARRLAQCSIVAAVNGVMLGHGDIDHVVLGPCLAAIETKHGRGPLGVGRNGELLVNGRRLARDPVEQARQAAAKLSRHLGCPVEAVVVVVDAEGEPVRVGGVHVTSLKYLPACLQALPAQLVTQSALTTARSLPIAG
jgi:hypothetical protein